MESPGARAAASANRMRPASCWKRLACDASMPRCRSCTCAWVQASVAARVCALRSRCLSASSSTCGASRGHAGPERDARRAARGHAQPVAQREYRIEHRAHRARQRAAFEHGERRAQLAPAADEAQAIGLEFQAVGHRPFDHRVMRGPHFRLVGRAAPAIGEQHALARQELGAHEHLGERRMRDVGRLGAEHQLGVGGHFDLARASGGVADRQAPHLGVVLRGDMHFERAW